MPSTADRMATTRPQNHSCFVSSHQSKVGSPASRDAPQRASCAQPPDLSRGVGTVQRPRIEQLAPFGEQVVRLVQRLYLAEIDVPKAQFGRGSILFGFLSPALERRAKAMGRDVPALTLGRSRSRRDTVCGRD